MEASRKLALIGPMGSGKSTLAKAYGAQKAVTVFDTDELFERRYGKISAYFERYGERSFRRLEAELIKEAVNSSCGIIACGGGAVLDKRGMNALRTHCDIAYLHADEAVLRSRIESSDRPLKNELGSILVERNALYERYADHTINANRAPSDVLSELCEKTSAPRKNRYDVLLCDADETVLDFNRAMRFALTETARSVGVRKSAEEVVTAYEKILPVVWGKLERGEITRDELASMRFTMLKQSLNERFDTKRFNDEYIENIKKTRFVIDGALCFLYCVRARGIRVYIITNSYKAVADQRLKALDGHIDGAFVSEDIGFDKPDARFFDGVFESLGNPDKSRVMVFGDGAYPDIHGGAAYGTDTCLFDPKHTAVSDEADFTAHCYDDLLRIL